MCRREHMWHVHYVLSPWVAVLYGEWAHAGLSLCRGQASGCANGIDRARSCDKVGEKQTWGRHLSHTHYKLLNLGALEISLVNKMFHL